MKIKPIGFHVLVLPDAVEEMSKGGILLRPDDREKTVITKGVVVDVAEGAWSDKPEGSYPKIGDRVIFAKHAGSVITDEESGKEYKLMIDEDIKAIITEEEK